MTISIDAAPAGSQIESTLFFQKPGSSLLAVPPFADGPERVRFAHILHGYVDQHVPFNNVAQEITFRSIREAVRYSSPDIEVSCFVVTYPGERHLIPDHCVAVPDIERSVGDVANFRRFRKLPLLFDILTLGAGAARQNRSGTDDEDFVIYTNSDIHVQPYFYAAISGLIRMGYDVLTVNRRTVGNHPSPDLNFPLLCADGGADHPGYDCFVFPLSLFEKFLHADVCVGAGYVARGLLYNMAAFGRRFALLTTAHLTFHIGDDGVWRNPSYDDYQAFNLDQIRDLATRLCAEPSRAAKLLEFVRRNGENQGIVSTVAKLAGVPHRTRWLHAAKRAIGLI